MIPVLHSRAPNIKCGKVKFTNLIWSMLFLIILYIYCRSWYLLRLKGISPVITHKQTGSDVYMHLSLPKLLSCILIIVFLCSLTTYEWQIKGKTNIHCLSKVLGHHVLPEQLQCALALILQVSGTLLEGRTPFFQKIFPYLVF